MRNSLISYLAEEPMLLIIRGLMTSPQPRHLRDLATQYKLSPAGVSDILRRLKETGFLKEEKQGNRRCISLQITDEERDCMMQFFSVHEMAVVHRRAASLGKNAATKLKGIDEMYSFHRKVKRKCQ